MCSQQNVLLLGTRRGEQVSRETGEERFRQLSSAVAGGLGQTTDGSSARARTEQRLRRGEGRAILTSEEMCTDRGRKQK
jgi:hypothetical protein